MNRIKIAFLTIFFIYAGFSQAQNSGILKEYWLNIPGTSVTDLTNSTLYPCNPSGYSIESSFKAPVNIADNYGTRMRGFVTAPVTGNYVLWISGDDNCELWLSTNESPSNKKLIARVTGWTQDQEWTKYPDQRSGTIYLESGKRYYIEAIHKEGSGGDNLAVGWQLPDGTLERPIGSNRLTPWPVQENYSTWTYSTPIVFNTSSSGANIQNDITDFPVLINLGTENSVIFQQAQPNGADLRFAAQDGTPLFYEIVNWNSTLKQAVIWVKVPRIRAASTQDRIIMYWGKSGSLSKSEPGAVFSYGNGFSNVWHLDDNVSNSTITDATGHFSANLENNASWENTDVRHVPGLAGGAIDFTGAERIPLYNYTPVQNNNEFTISVWVNADLLTNMRGIWYTPEWGSYGKVRIYGNSNWGYENSTGSQYTELQSQSTTSSWVNLVATQKIGGNVEFFVNGVSVGTQSFPAKGPHGGNSFIGSEESSNYFDGKIDEVAFSTVSRSSDWIKLWYEGQKLSQKLLTIGEPGISAPSGLTATYMNGTDIVLSWNDNANNETGFEISKRVGNSLPVVVASIGANQTNYVDHIGTICGNQFVYMIKATNSTSVSMIVESNPVYIKPCVPVNLAATPVSENEILISWNGSAAEFALEGKKQSDATFSEIYRGSGLQFNHQGLACQSTWNYRIKGINSAGSSGWAEATASTNNCAILSPSNLTADNSIANQIKLMWNDQSTNEDGFKIFRKKEGESSFTEIGSTSAANGTGNYTDNAVLCNTSYSYYVIAFNSTSVSGASNTITSKTLYCGAGKSTSEMISINGMYLDGSGNAVTGKRLAVVRLYNTTDLSQTPVYEESFTDVDIKNGYFSIPAGLINDLSLVIRNHNTLYYDVLIDGTSVFNLKAQPLTASPYSIKNSFNLAGNGSPNTLIIDAPVGATWVDTANKLLWVKYGSAGTEWKQIGN